MLVAFLKYRRADGPWRETPMRHVDNDRWAGVFPLPAPGRYVYTVEALAGAVSHVARRLPEAPRRGRGARERPRRGAGAHPARGGAGDCRGRSERARLLRRPPCARQPARRRRWRSPATRSWSVSWARHIDRTAATRADRELEVVVDRERARFAAWYEMFPRSGAGADRSATFREAEKELSRALRRWASTSSTCRRSTRSDARTARDATTRWSQRPAIRAAPGRSAAPTAASRPSIPTSARSTTSIGSSSSAARLGPRGRPRLRDPVLARPSVGPRSIRSGSSIGPTAPSSYAENPPKKYQDIYPLNFERADPRPLWEAMRRILEFWIGHGVRTFRVDNPHTKPREVLGVADRAVQDAHPDVIFLAEAFTRPQDDAGARQGRASPSPTRTSPGATTSRS